MKQLLLTIGFLVVSALVAPASRAFADMIPAFPPCPPGQIAKRSHSGSTCVLPPPKNCPVGWIGVDGGHCILHTCQDACNYNDLQCKPLNVCVEVRSAPELQRGHQVGTRTAYFSSNVCSSDATCSAPAKCRPSGVCLPKNVAKAAPRPSNAIEDEGATPRDANAKDAPSPSSTTTTTAPPDPLSVPPSGTIDLPPPSSIDDASAATAPTPSVRDAPVASADTIPKDTAPRGGCSGCRLGGVASHSENIVAMTAMIFASALFVRRKRRREK